MKMISATDLAIALAHREQTLRVTICPSRLGGTFAAIEDDCGVIEVWLSKEQAEDRISNVLSHA